MGGARVKFIDFYLPGRSLGPTPNFSRPASSHDMSMTINAHIRRPSFFPPTPPSPPRRPRGTQCGPIGPPWGPRGPQVLYTQLIFYIFKKSLKYKAFPLYFFQELNSKLSQLERVRFSQDFRFFLIFFDFFFSIFIFLVIFLFLGIEKS